MSLGFKRGELSNDFILSISEEVGMIHKTEKRRRSAELQGAWTGLDSSGAGREF
jgi:hypothetical protein